MSHFVDVGGTEDYEYFTDECKQLAITDSKQALYNADSFEFYVENAH